MKNTALMALLLCLKGVFLQTDPETICAPVGSELDLFSECSGKNDSLCTWMWKSSLHTGETLEHLRDDSRFIGYVKDFCLLIILDLEKNDAGTYYCRSTNRDDQDDQDVSPGITVYVTDLQVNVSPATVTESGNITLTCNTSCPLTNSKHTIIWYKNDMTLNHSDDELSPISSEDTGRYSCALQNYTDFPSDEILLSVRYAPRNTRVSVVFGPGSTVTLTCGSDANPPPTFTWFNTAVPAQRQGHGQNFTTAVRNGNFYCEASNTIGSQNSSVTQLTAGRLERVEIISLFSLLSLIALLFISAALWMKMEKLRRPGGKDHNRQDDTVYANVSSLAVTSDLEERKKSDHQNELQYSHVYFKQPSKSNAQNPATSAQEAEVQYAVIRVSERSAAP